MLVRVHLLRRMRGRRAEGELSELRRQPRAAAYQAARGALEVSGIVRARSSENTLRLEKWRGVLSKRRAGPNQAFGFSLASSRSASRNAAESKSPDLA